VNLDSDGRGIPVIENIEEHMLYNLGRFLQLVGLIILPIAMAGEVAESLTLGRMLVWACVGLGVFMIGRMLQQSAKPE
jgi:sulfite exporter TauE/SafE